MAGLFGNEEEAEIESLRQQLERHNRLYYVDARPEITDREYDTLMAQLIALEKARPEFMTADSPSVKVGGAPIAGFTQVTHRVPMLSIENVFYRSIAEIPEGKPKTLATLERWDQTVCNELGRRQVEYSVEYKIDGVALSIVWEHGNFVRAVTRGNGAVGDDVTSNASVITGIPRRLLTNHPPASVEVRGEVFIENEEFCRFQAEQVRSGEEPFKNPRNAAAGALKLLDPEQSRARNLRFLAHGFGFVDGLSWKNHTEFVSAIRDLGVPTASDVTVVSGFEELLAICGKMIERVPELPFEVDGIVIKVNAINDRIQLGATSKSPRWVRAFKWEKYDAETELLGISIQVGKSGAITPVADLAPVEIDNTTVSQASLHNVDIIRQNDFRIHDRVVVEKAGKIIPRLVRVVMSSRPKVAVPYIFPTQCPSCSSELVTDEGQSFIPFEVPTAESCVERLSYYIRPFSSAREMIVPGLGITDARALNIVGLGPTRLRKLHWSMGLTEYSDLYHLDHEQLIGHGGVGSEVASAILSSIEQSKHWGLERLLVALAIPNVGPWTATQIVTIYRSISELMAASREELTRQHFIGKQAGASLFEFLSAASVNRWLGSLETAGVSMDANGSKAPRGLVVCPNASCPAQLRERLKFFVQRQAMEIDGMGDKLIEQVVDHGLVRTYADLFRLTVEKLSSLDRMGKKSSANLIVSIEKAKSCELHRFVTGLAIKHVGETTAIALSSHFCTIENLMQSTPEELLSIPDIGPITAHSIHRFFSAAGGREIVQDLLLAGVRPQLREVQSNLVVSNTLGGKTLVVTGTMVRMRRDEIEQLIRDHGGKASSSVSKKTDYVVAGEAAGSKLTKAQELGVTVLTEDEFLAMVNPSDQ